MFFKSLSFYLVALLVVLILTISLLRQKPKQIIKQIDISSDPQYLIVNESDLLKDKIFWDAPEEKWQKEIKPEIKKRLEKIRQNLGTGTRERLLGWSIIVQYMDYPLDTPSSNSSYVVMTRRLMEVSEELDFPVFIPLNGFQWWNQLPELWNWWDSGPDQIEGCQNEKWKETEKDPDGNVVPKCKFPELRDPEFRARFAKGYNPDNKWNVEWTNWNTPMRENWRNWGGGFFQIAPIPNLVDHKRNRLTFRSVQRDRLDMIYEEIYQKLKRWESQKKLYLFAGISIGTEVSLHTSDKDKSKFEVKGYRGLQDTYCEENNPFCGEHANWSLEKLKKGREEIIYKYLRDLSKEANESGLPKQRIYTHVWSENVPPDKQFLNYFSNAVNEYSRPGLSLYGYAEKPLDLEPFKTTMQKNKNLQWAAPEFNLPKDGDWEKALNAVFDSSNSAKLIDIYNWNVIENTDAVSILRRFLH